MKKSTGPKIVVAIGLAAVYGTGLAMVTLRDATDKHAAPKPVIAQTAEVAPATQVIEQPAVVAEAPAPSTESVSKPAVVSRAAESVRVEAPAREVNSAREQGSASAAAGMPADTRDAEKPISTGEPASVGNESADSKVEAPASVEAESGSAADGGESAAADEK